MLSELSQLQFQLFRLIESWQDLKRFVQPSPEIPMGKQVHPKQSHQIRKRPGEFGSKLEKPKDQHRNQCCPNLDLDGIGTGADKGLDLEVLLQSFKEDLHLPAIFIDRGNGGRSQLELIGEKEQDFIGFWVIDFNPPQRIGTFLDRSQPPQLNEFIFENMAVLGEYSFSYDLIDAVFFHPSDKVDTLSGPSTEQRIISISSVVDDNGPRSKTELRHDFHIGHLPLGNDGKGGQIPVMIQEQMQFDGSLGPSEVGPVKDRQTEVNGRRIETDQFVLKTEFLFLRNLTSTAVQEFEKEELIKLPGAVFIRIGQSRVAGSVDPQMFQLPFTTSQPSGDLPERMGTTQLAEEHGHKLSPAGKPPSMPLGFRLSDRVLEFDSRKQL